MTAGCICKVPVVKYDGQGNKHCLKCGNWHFGEYKEPSEHEIEKTINKIHNHEFGEEGQRKFPKKVTNFTPKKKKRKK